VAATGFRATTDARTGPDADRRVVALRGTTAGGPLTEAALRLALFGPRRVWCDVVAAATIG
jgi:hypothetical protein